MVNDNSADNEEKRRQNQINFIVEQQARIDENLESVTERLDRLTENVNVFVGETRGAFNNLIVANAVTRELAQQVAARRADQPPRH